jgi:hypothetical protein
MKTFKELNEKAWYRLLKVLYVLLYLPCLIVLLFAYDAGKDYHPPVYPNTIVEALNDPEFYKVDDWEKKMALSALDENFNKLPSSEQTLFINQIKKFDIKTKEFGKFEGKTVLVEGKILGVCKEKGCWLDIAGEKENEKIRIKAVEHEIVFPKDALGKTALVEGVFAQVKKEADAKKDKGEDKHEMTEQNKTDERQHNMTEQQKKAEEQKHEKMAEHKMKEDDMHSSMGMMKKAYQIKVTGAVIKE